MQYQNRNKQLGSRKLGIPASNNARKYYRKLAKLQKKKADKRNDFLQKLTTDLARKYRHIRLETLPKKIKKSGGLKAPYFREESH